MLYHPLLIFSEERLFIDAELNVAVRLIYPWMCHITRSINGYASVTYISNILPTGPRRVLVDFYR